MATDAFSEKRIQAHPLALDPNRTAVLVVDMVNEFFAPGGKRMLEGGTALYAPVNALLDAVHQAHLPVFYTNQRRPAIARVMSRAPFQHVVASLAIAKERGPSGGVQSPGLQPGGTVTPSQRAVGTG